MFEFPIDEITLLLTFVQTAISVLAYFESGEKIMENRNNTVWCGTRGVIKYVCEILRDKQKCYKRAAIGSNPVRSAIFQDYLHAGSPFLSVSKVVVDFVVAGLAKAH